MTRRFTTLLLTMVAAVPFSTAWVAANGSAPANAATKKATPTPAKKSTHKKKKTPAKHKAKATPTPKPKKKKTTHKPKPTPTPTPTATPTLTNISGTFAGPTIDMRWGPVQVTVTIQNRQITDVKATVSPETSRSQMIDNRSIPLLKQETLQAQSANIDVVSGATQTSDAFIRSLQGALNKAGF